MFDLAADGWRVTLVNQPWVVAGRKVAAPPAHLDEAWSDVLAALRRDMELGVKRFVLAGRSAGARVACRTAATEQADAVVALAFPLIPPGKRETPDAWRTSEAQGVIDAGIPLLIVQGRKDPFATPDEIATYLPKACLAAVEGIHSFTPEPVDVIAGVREFLAALK